MWCPLQRERDFPARFQKQKPEVASHITLQLHPGVVAHSPSCGMLFMTVVRVEKGPHDTHHQQVDVTGKVQWNR